MFTPALFTMVKIWKQGKCPSTDSATNKNEILPFAATTWMDLQGIILSEIGQAKKDKYHMISLTCRI